MKYHHLGIPTKEKIKYEIYLPHLKMHVSDHEKNPYKIQWMRFDDNADYPEIVKTVPHVAFEVEDIYKAIKDKNVIIEPNSPSAGVVVAFIEDNGAPVEFLQIDPTIAEGGV